MNYNELIKTLKEDHSYWKQPILVIKPDGETFYITYWEREEESGSFYHLAKCNGGYVIGVKAGCHLLLSDCKFKLFNKIDYKTLIEKLGNKELWARVIKVFPPVGEPFYVTYMGGVDCLYLVNKEDGLFTMGPRIGLHRSLTTCEFELIDAPASGHVDLG